MPATTPGGHEGWTLGRRGPGLKELTIELGDADIYVNMSRKVELDNGHTLFEAVLTDPTGSRAIYIDLDDVVECLRDTFLTGSQPKSEEPPGPRAEARKPPRGTS
jgi:hypothetical protein